MDMEKRKRLVEALSEESDPLLVRMERFLDGNDDEGSLGCNLPEHPGMDVFRATFEDLLSRRDVTDIYALVSEIDPGEDCWPFSDTVLVVGSIPADALRQALQPLEPDAIKPAEDHDLLSSTLLKPGERALVAWWD